PLAVGRRLRAWRGSAPARRRQLYDEAAADLQLGAGDVLLAVPDERRAPRLVAAGAQPAAGQRVEPHATPAGVEDEDGPAQPAAAQAAPAADDLEALAGPLEALELEADLAHRRHHASSVFSGSVRPSSGSAG